MEHVLNTFFRVVKGNGSAPAVSDENGSFSYRELYDYGRTVAANLQAHGIERGSRVIVEIPRCKEYPGCMLLRFRFRSGGSPVQLRFTVRVLSAKRFFLCPLSGEKAR